MTVNIRFFKTLAAIFIVTMLVMPFVSCNANKDISGKTIKGTDVNFERPQLKILTGGEINAKWTDNRPADTGQKPKKIQSIPAICINNGKYLAEESKKDIVTAGEISDTYALGVEIVGEGYVGGLVVKGIGSEYTLSDANIELSGDGTGMGTGAAVEDHATLIIRNSNITCSGQRNAVSCKRSSTLKVYNSTLVGHGSPFDPLAETPNPIDNSQYLEIRGNSRTTETTSNSYIYFYNSTIIADGWGACSTDQSGQFVYQEANNCKIKTVKSGYGAYADWFCHDIFNNCEFDVASMAVIIAGEADATFRETKANCGTYFAMMHCVTGSHTEVGTLRVTGGEIACKSPAVIVKSHNAIIKFDDVKIAAESGILVKSIVNPDPNATRVEGDVYGIHATFKDMDAVGDIIHEDPARIMSISLESAILKGAVKNAYITIDGASRWIATADSQVAILGSVDVAQIDAPKGVTINAVADESGTYILVCGGALILRES
ncbi:MAG: hypothetical protein JW944_01605 [Deltaproteobacteria bacterium]|nr:hypothetical protein [Deltaproteobacteria bacterium]